MGQDAVISSRKACARYRAHHAGQFTGALASDFVIVKHCSERHAERFAAACISDVADLFPANVRRRVGIGIGGKQHFLGNVFQPGAQVLG